MKVDICQPMIIKMYSLTRIHSLNDEMYGNMQKVHMYDTCVQINFSSTVTQTLDLFKHARRFVPGRNQH